MAGKKTGVSLFFSEGRGPFWTEEGTGSCRERKSSLTSGGVPHQTGGPGSGLLVLLRTKIPSGITYSLHVPGGFGSGHVSVDSPSLLRRASGENRIKSEPKSRGVSFKFFAPTFVGSPVCH